MTGEHLDLARKVLATASERIGSPASMRAFREKKIDFTVYLAAFSQTPLLLGRKLIGNARKLVAMARRTRSLRHMEEWERS